MQRSIVYVGGEADVRMRGIGGVLHRSHVDHDTSGDGDPDPGTTAAVDRLRRNGSVFVFGADGERESLVYAPTPEAKKLIADELGESRTTWGAKVVKHFSQSVQAIKGALFTFPVEGTDDLHLRAFITDWTPFPAACALVVHPSHILADDIDNAPNRPTGRFVRHPLNGDLLPLWTGDWVRPGLGTGAVVLNPAHSAVDLDFARLVGLPIRFSLAPTPPTSDAGTWIDPPFIAAGVAVRTGIADGASSQEAQAVYLTSLEESGWAHRFVDRALGTLPLADLPRGAIRAGATGDDVDLESDIATILAGPLGEGSVFVGSGRSVERLLLLRALHIDLHGVDVVRPRVIITGQVNVPPTSRATDDVLQLAALGAARIDEVATVKPQMIEQVERFVGNHAALSETYEPHPSGGGSKKIDGILADIADSRFSTAFAELYKVQRDLKKNPDQLPSDERRGYFVASYVLAGLNPPDGFDLGAALLQANLAQS